jgi:glycosyltransferase involved in cell wall biosynthesis
MKHEQATAEPNQYLIVINNLSFFYSHFWNLAIAVRDAGWSVSIAANQNASTGRISENGMTFVPLPQLGGLKNLAKNLQYCFALRRLLLQICPTVTHFIYLQNVLLGGIVARVVGCTATIGAVTGLGSLFAEDHLHYKLIRRLVMAGIRWGFTKNNSVMAFENLDDRKYFVDHGSVDESRTTIIPGAGVAKNEIVPSHVVNNDKPVVLLASRMIRNKGVQELVDAAVELHNQKVDFEVWLVGDVDANNPTSFSTEELNAFGRLEFVKYLGYRRDVAQLMSKTDIFCLPTSYREGLPRVIIEACAAGVAVVTTDMPGCREIIQNDVNGILVPPRDHEALVSALARLLCDPALRTSMGARGRMLFEEKFTLDACLRSFNVGYLILEIPLHLKCEED